MNHFINDISWINKSLEIIVDRTVRVTIAVVLYYSFLGEGSGRVQRAVSTNHECMHEAALTTQAQTVLGF